MQLQNAGLPVVGVDSTGHVDYSRTLTNAEKIKTEQIISSFDPSTSIDQDPLLEFHQRGFSSDQLLAALWKQVVMGDESDAQHILMELDR
jgi:hypothetical protein